MQYLRVVITTKRKKLIKRYNAPPLKVSQRLSHYLIGKPSIKGHILVDYGKGFRNEADFEDTKDLIATYRSFTERSLLKYVWSGNGS